MNDKPTEPFAPLDGSKPALRVVANDIAWILVAPVPANAPEPPAKHPKLGKPSRCSAYLSSDGELLGYMLRFDPPSGKEFRPLALWRPARGGALEWRWQSWTEPRPLYGLDRLAARPSAPVILCEGEKAADAASRLLPAYIAMTSPNGSKSAKKSDWTPLRGRHVIIWPDADEPGAKYAEAVSAELFAVGAERVAILAPPAGVADAWDADNAEQEGWTPEQAAALVASAQPVAGPQKGEAGGAKGKRERRPPARDTILSLTEGCAFWHSPDQTAYVTFPVNGHVENWKVDSKQFRRWLTGQAYKHQNTVPARKTIDDALCFLEGKAIHDGPQREPFLRTGARDGRIYIDLGDSTWRVVEINPADWRILDTHDLPIIRSDAMQALPEPVREAPTNDLYSFVNVASEDDYKLVFAWLIAALRPRGPYPILLIQGEQGSGKSILSRLLRSIVDPNVAPIRAAPKDNEDLIVAAKNGHVIALDNVSRIDPIMADALCRVATGGGFSTRVKYTNDEEHVVWTVNPILANGIPSMADRPDLASRALIVRLRSIPEDQRRPEDEYFAEWNKVAPGVLGTIFDALARALFNLPNVRLPRSSRMADFEKLIEAAAPALAWERGSFSRAYAANRKDLEGAAFEADPLAMAIERLIVEDHPSGWSGTATKLLEEVSLKVAEGLKRSRQWPQTAQGVGNRLDRCIPLLRSRGIIVERHVSAERTIIIAPAKPL